MRAVRGRLVMGAGLVLVLAVLLLATGLGAVPVPAGEVVGILLNRLPGVEVAGDWPAAHEVILWDVRLPRVILGLLAGIGLAAAGAAFQGLFRNPMADPYVVGVSAGAALGASLAIVFMARLQVRFIGPVPLAAFAGGLAATFLVYRLAAVGGRLPVLGLLLAGVSVGSISTALLSLVLYLTTPQARDAILFWLMGGLGAATWRQVAWLVPYTALGLGVLMYYSRELNALLMGEEEARHLGVDAERVKAIVLLAGTLLAASAVAFSGTIGFVGLVVPHTVRFLVGPDHRYLIPAAALGGGALLMAADALARTALRPHELPVGLIMAVTGGPFFLYLLRRHLRPPAGQ